MHSVFGCVSCLRCPSCLLPWENTSPVVQLWLMLGYACRLAPLAALSFPCVCSVLRCVPLVPCCRLSLCMRVSGFGLFQGWSSPHRPAHDASPPAFAPGHATAVVLAPAQAIHLCAAPTPAILVLWQPVCSGCCLCAQATHIHSYILLVMKLWSVACVVWGSQRCRI